MRWKSLFPRGKWHTRYCLLPKRTDSGETCWLEKVRVKWQARQILTEEEYQKMNKE